MFTRTTSIIVNGPRHQNDKQISSRNLTNPPCLSEPILDNHLSFNANIVIRGVAKSIEYNGRDIGDGALFKVFNNR
jgi:hypothetical protein